MSLRACGGLLLQVQVEEERKEGRKNRTNNKLTAHRSLYFDCICLEMYLSSGIQVAVSLFLCVVLAVV